MSEQVFSSCSEIRSYRAVTMDLIAINASLLPVRIDIAIFIFWRVSVCVLNSVQEFMVHMKYMKNVTFIYVQVASGSLWLP